MPLSFLAIDNTPLSQLLIKAIATGPAASSACAPSATTLNDLPHQLGPQQLLIINSSVPDFARLPRCPYPDERVAVLVSRLTPLGPDALADLGYRHVLDKDGGFDALCAQLRRWQRGLTSPARTPSAGGTPSHAQLEALVAAGLARIEGDIHAHMEQLVSRWLGESLEPTLARRVEDQLPQLVATALAAELDRLSQSS